MAENKLIEYNNRQLEKIDNQISNLNKLIANSNEKLANKYFKKAFFLVYKQQKYNDASEWYLKAIMLKPDLIEALNSHAQNLRCNLKNYLEAIVYYTKVIELDPKFEYALFQRGICKGALKDYEGQIHDYSKVIEFDPTSDNYISRAIVKGKINDHKGVIEDCTIAIYLNKNNSFPFWMRGYSYSALLNFNYAIDDFNKSIEIDEEIIKSYPKYKPRFFVALKGRGFAKLSINDFQGALADFERLMILNPNHPEPYNLIAKAKRKLGDIAGCNKDLETFRHLNTEYFKKYKVSFED